MRLVLFALMFFAGASTPENLTPWVGTWTSTQPASKDFRPDRLVIWKSRTMPGALHVLGSAYWYGPMVEYDGKPVRDVHFGKIDADGVPARDALVLHEQGCEVTLTMADGEIHTSDNVLCGGMNVRFRGTFVRHKG